MPIKTSNNTSITKIYGKTAGKHLSQSAIPPINFHSNTDNISYSIYGNLVQSETPSPTNPIIPVEVGEKTDNLCSQTTVTTENPNKNIGSDSDLVKAFKTLTAGENYTLSWDFQSTSTTGVRDVIRLYNGATYMNVQIENGVSFSLTAEQISDLTAFVLYFGADGGTMSDFMLNLGSTPLPYEPYGKYKIPVSINSTITNIYLNNPIRKIGNYSDIVNDDGTVTRIIGKNVYKGTEQWTVTTSGNKKRAFTPNYSYLIPNSPAFCTHFLYNSQNIGYPNVGEFVVNATKAIIFGLDGEQFTDLDAWKTYLSQQYTNGNPITVWYVLATPETETITSPTLTPQEGSNTIDINTTLKPSNLTIGYTAQDYSEIVTVLDKNGNAVYDVNE